MVLLYLLFDYFFTSIDHWICYLNSMHLQLKIIGLTVGIQVALVNNHVLLLNQSKTRSTGVVNYCSLKFSVCICHHALAVSLFCGCLFNLPHVDENFLWFKFLCQCNVINQTSWLWITKYFSFSLSLSLSLSLWKSNFQLILLLLTLN